MRMQVILDYLFARPGSAPICGGKKGEFRDWTKRVFVELFGWVKQILSAQCLRALILSKFIAFSCSLCTYHLLPRGSTPRTTPENSSYRSYQRFQHINEAKGAFPTFSIELTLDPRLHIVVNKGGFARGRNCFNSYYCSWQTKTIQSPLVKGIKSLQ